MNSFCEFRRDGSGPEETDLTEPLVTFPDPDTPPPVSDAVALAGGSPAQLSSLNSLNNLHHGISPPMNIPNMANLPAGQETMKFEQKKMTSASKTKVSNAFLVSIYFWFNYHFYTNKCQEVIFIIKN